MSGMEFTREMNDESGHGVLHARVYKEPMVGIQIELSSYESHEITFDSVGWRDFADDVWRAVAAIDPEEAAAFLSDEELEAAP